MQDKKSKRSNAQRTEETKQALIQAARALFSKQGYMETGTPDIVRKAGVTRGALYHHYGDKAELFEAVLKIEAQAVSRSIEEQTSTDMAPLDALIRGADAYFDAMQVPGRAKMLLIDGPSALGHERMQTIAFSAGGEELKIGLGFLLSEQNDQDLLVLANLLSAMFDRAALMIASGGDSKHYRDQIKLILSCIATK